MEMEKPLILKAKHGFVCVSRLFTGSGGSKEDAYGHWKHKRQNSGPVYLINSEGYYFLCGLYLQRKHLEAHNIFYTERLETVTEKLVADTVMTPEDCFLPIRIQLEKSDVVFVCDRGSVEKLEGDLYLAISGYVV